MSTLQLTEHVADTAGTKRRSTDDVVFAPILSVLLLLVSGASLIFSNPTFTSGLSCWSAEQCKAPDLFTTAEMVGFAGMAIGAVIAIVGLLVAWRRRTALAIWPGLGLAIVLATYFVGLTMALVGK